METKRDIILEICDLVSIPEYTTTVGSSIPRRFFSELLDTFEIEDDGDSVTACKRLLELGGQVWKNSYASESTPSGGGGTVTLEGLKALRDSVILLLDEFESTQEEKTSQIDSASPDEWTLLRGQSILRTLLHDRYSGIRQGGIAPSRKTKNIFLFTDDSSNNEHGYETDYWSDDFTFNYCGDGQIGNQELTRRNRQVLNHELDGRKLRLFRPVLGKVTYLGELKIDSKNPYVIKQGIGRNGKPRNVIMFRLKRVVEGRFDYANFTEGFGESKNLEKDYVFAIETSRQINESDPFNGDPNLLDRALQIHSITQNTVANWLIGHSVEPKSPNTNYCDFDIAWESDFGKVVCEVKSLSDQNEIHQFRFGLGQILEYSQKLGAIPVLMFSRKPKSVELIDAANKVGVLILWPEILNKFLPKDLRSARGLAGTNF